MTVSFCWNIICRLITQIQDAMTTKLFLVCAFTLFLSACGSDSGGSASDLVGPGNSNDDPITPAGPVSFSKDVVQIFHSTCAGSGCHINNVKNGVNRTTHSTVMGSIGQQYSGPIVVAGNATLSPIVDKLGSNPRFGDRMPDGKSALSTSQISTISSWINEGALNN
jgi:hypothetical protein